MSDPYNIGQPVKMIISDFGGAWSGVAPTPFTIYDDSENVLTLGPEDYLIFQSYTASLIPNNESVSEPFVYIEDGQSGPLLLLINMQYGQRSWTCGGEGLYTTPGKTPYVLAEFSTPGSSSAVIFEGRLVRESKTRTGYQNPILQ
jgi:hypothetical protein